MAKINEQKVVEALMHSEQLSSDYFQLKLREFFHKHNISEASGDLETLRELAAELLQDTFMELSSEGVTNDLPVSQVASQR